MKLSPLISEQSEHQIRNSSVSNESLPKLLLTDYKDAYEAYWKTYELRFYRGKRAGDGIHITDPRVRERGSSGSSSIHPYLLDHMKSWSSYPKRTKSVKFTGNSEVANMYGSAIYHVFPYNNANFGVSPVNDFWDAFDDLRKHFGSGASNLVEFCKIIVIVYNQVGGVSKNVEVILDTLNKLISDKKAFKEFVTERMRRSDISRLDEMISGFAEVLYKDVTTHNLDMDGFFEKYLSPQKNKFEVVNGIQSLHGFTENEIWTDSKCLLIPEGQVPNMEQVKQ